MDKPQQQLHTKQVMSTVRVGHMLTVVLRVVQFKPVQNKPTTASRAVVPAR